MTQHTRLLAGDAGDRRLTPEEVRATVFPSAGFSRGLNAEQVTLFMHRVADELDLCNDEYAGLQEQVARQQEELQQLRARPAPVPANGSYLPGLPEPEKQGVYVLQRAQQTADNLVASAQEQARSMMADGRQQRERMLADGHSQRQRVVAQALDEAGREAARIIAQAPVRAQEELAFTQALGKSASASLGAFLAMLNEAVRVFEEQQRQGMKPPPPPRVPTGPQPAMPLP